MTTKEKVINESIIKAKKRLNEVKKLIDARPISDLIEVRKELQVLLNENKTINERISTEFIRKIDILSKKEKHCIKLAKQLTGEKMIDLIDEQINIEFELRDLENQKYFIERSKRN